METPTIVGNFCPNIELVHFLQEQLSVEQNILRKFHIEIAGGDFGIIRNLVEPIPGIHLQKVLQVEVLIDLVLAVNNPVSHKASLDNTVVPLHQNPAYSNHATKTR